MRLCVSARVRSLRSDWQRYVFFLVVLASIALPALAQEGAPSPADSPTGFVFRWLNLALVLGAFTWVIVKFGGPFFRGAAKSIQDAIHGAAAGRAAAERELSEASRQLASLDAEAQEMRRAASRESASEAERLRALARSEAEKIAKAAVAEIEAAERSARQQLRGIAARAATDRAAALVRQRMNDQAERSLFDVFLGELERGAQ
jgi:F0F1-type ATP synthase membrane subunit b/b'